ncbi:MAG: LLM class flavin-dependent oxidoreductase [Acidimicrobiia bacterium]|nr:LLM class flavin-dependent oxidoreductase [Acidimicrobiia bacterium]NNF65002.1 LLM class flavin-dependent oxidoreductase [Acidimicrobiia bacterium]
MDYALQVVGAYDHVLEIARVCERRGAAAVALADHYLYGSDDDRYQSAAAYDSLVQAAALGRDTTDIEIVMLVSPVTFRHPAVYAKSTISIDELSGGRFVLGLGTGWHDDEHGYFGIPYPDRNERFGMLEDGLGYLHKFFTAPEDGFTSDRYSFKGLSYKPAARSDLRLLVGGSGPKRTPTLAGTFGGEYSVAGTEPDGITAKVETMRRAAAAAGRDPDSIMVTISSVVVSGDSDAEITENIGRIDSTGRSPQEVRQAYEKRGLVFRTWDEHRERFSEFAEAGVDRVYLQLVSQDAGLADEALVKLRQ